MCVSYVFYVLYAVAGETCCNSGELDLTGIDDDELDQVCYSQSSQSEHYTCSG